MKKENEETLRYLLSSVNEWLRFAEAKNGVLFVTNVGIATTLIRVMPKVEYGRGLILMMIMLLFVSALICLCSYVPRLHPPRRSGWASIARSEQMNLLFFGDISRMDMKTYTEMLVQAGLMTPDEEKGQIAAAFAAQIWNNSVIAARKFVMFDGALWVFIAAMLTPVGALLVWLYTKHDPSD